VAQALAGKKVALGFVVALGVVIGALLYSYMEGRTLHGDILVELPIPPSTETASERLLIRRGFDQRRHLFMLRERGGEEVWRERRVLYALQEGTLPVIAGGLVLVRTRRSSGLHETHAFDVATGEYKWASATPLPPFDATGGPGPTFVSDGLVTEVYMGDPGEIIGVNLADGEERYRQTVRVPAGAEVTLVGQRLTVSSDPPQCFSQRSGAPTDCAP
jgi:outer membrane protein assembly factor BamB